MKIENAIFTNSFKNYIKTKIKTHKIFSEIKILYSLYKTLYI